MIGNTPTNGNTVGVPVSARGFASERMRPLVPEVRSPTLRRRELGVRLRGMRLDHGWTVEQVADQMLCSPSKISRMETGQRGATPRDVRDLCRIYGLTDAAEVQRLMGLAREGKQQAWWQPYELDYFATYVDLEQVAAALSYYDTTIVPGLLQTVDYARAMFAWALPSHSPASERRDLVIEHPPERRAQLIDVRLRRQQVLTRDPPPQIVAFLDEAVLRRVVGGPKVMGAQLRRLLEASEMPNVTVRVIPFVAGAHAAMDNIFTVLDFADAVPSVVYVEGLMGWLYLEREAEVARYKRVLEHLHEVALPQRETIELISEVGAQYASAS
jgi:transcriptional regulator with XRE-family HTH domain